MKIWINVNVEGQYCKGGAMIEVPELMYKAFEPLKTSDDVLFAIALGEVMTASTTANVVMKIRKDAAKYLSEALTRQLLAEMMKHDTHNGYKIEGE